MTKSETYKEYDKIIKTVSEQYGYCGPHCDSLVLHPRGECHYCDMGEFGLLHKAREDFGINYTGQTDRTKFPCPAEDRRAKETIDKWPGNQAKSKETSEKFGSWTYTDKRLKSFGIKTVRRGIFQAIDDERQRQNLKFAGDVEGIQHHNIYKWLAIIGEELGESNKAVLDYDFRRDPFTTEPTTDIEVELIQTAACCVALLERIRLKDEVLWL